MITKEEYYKKHEVCPKCGGKDNIQTLVGCIARDNDWTKVIDTNDVFCHCGWKGKIHQMVERKTNE